MLPLIPIGRKWAARLKELGEQDPPQGLVDKINNGKEQKKKIASPTSDEKDLEA
jgi:hypothetical protein